ncbi:hypothetical protein QBC38DRAFT_185709 [Podospora fimiseda]|uniref:Uncharacterized protein n=1 Tax=Podospora fimiseda TaxID=252190 RepID=A0AAN7GV67_9PEZI|nr:hypothetical protein QBC38DRAFT_185709 [Podospora fimiseda]
MDSHHPPHDYATSNVLAWTTTHSANVEPLAEEDAADADEPPDCLQSMSPLSTTHFTKRTPVRQGGEHQESLLTKAFQGHSDEENHEFESSNQRRRRRSITSNFSFTSTAEYSCDTGITTPARTSSPSPRLPTIGFMPYATTAVVDVAKTPVPTNGAPKKRTISFACAAKPDLAAKAAMPPPPKPEAAPKKTTIKFACPAAPQRDTTAAPQRDIRPMTPVPTAKIVVENQKARSPSTLRSTRSPTARKTSASSACKKWLTANHDDLESDSAHFHEFASDAPREDDWIRRDDVTSKPKLTIQDTLSMENAIRKLGKEAEEEAELEEELENGEVDQEEDDEDDLEGAEDDGSQDGDDDDDDLEEDVDEDDEEADGEVDDEDAATEYAWDDEASDGYKTDNEIGFAESDDEDDDLILWTTRIGHHPTLSGAVAAARRPSLDSDSSACERSAALAQRKKRSKSRRALRIRPATPELPDSTDFVCGTFDEDRPLEEAYISCVEARKREKLKAIPQDIDPSFPTSEPEDEEEDGYGNAYGESDNCAWLHGEFEDLHEDLGRRGRKKITSPKRFQSPPPKRHHSPAPKARGGRSPKKVTDRSPPRRMRSPAPQRMANRSPLSATPAQDSDGIAYKSLAFRPGLRSTKSLPKAPGIFPHFKGRKSKNPSIKETTHVRGAIDIVKGLEAKRARRKEKFYQKYCSRARKEKEPKRPAPGQGVERMRELGLIMAGKVGPSHYVLSV